MIMQVCLIIRVDKNSRWVKWKMVVAPMIRILIMTSFLIWFVEEENRKFVKMIFLEVQMKRTDFIWYQFSMYDYKPEIEWSTVIYLHVRHSYILLHGNSISNDYSWILLNSNGNSNGSSNCNGIGCNKCENGRRDNKTSTGITNSKSTNVQRTVHCKNGHNSAEAYITVFYHYRTSCETHLV